ncbi:MAG TPA: hypothetical protein VHL79_22525 [Ramlibacter sp.]|jgi:hypothetical protein|nr:hypothetical protein [Ramlibacter sp.]
MNRRDLLQAGLVLATLAPGLARAQQPRTVRLRGTIEALSAEKLTIRTRNGERHELAIAPDARFTEVYPVTLADVKSGSFVGVGGMPQADGSQRAIAVVVFPEAMRGTGEGHYPFDFLPQSTMTNATVADVAGSPDGQRLQLRYKDGEKMIVVPKEAPVVSLRPADRTLLAVGSGVSLTAQEINGTPTAVRISAGRNGFSPPY